MRIGFFITEVSINGADSVLRHIGCALKEMGHEVVFANIGAPIPEGLDIVWFQSQWYGAIKDKLDSVSAKRVCWIEHFNPPEIFKYYRLEDIEADFYNTQYKGEALSFASKKVGREVYYLPHAACTFCMREGNPAQDYPKRVIVMNRNEYKDESWLELAGVTILPSEPDKVADVYRSAHVVANLHAEFQKGLSADYLGMTGKCLNERVFQAIMAGGFVVNDNNEILREFFEEDEVPMGMTWREYAYSINHFDHFPGDREPYMIKAKERILREHTYLKRIEQYAKDTDNWRFGKAGTGTR